jgi:hypothetical protein
MSKPAVFNAEMQSYIRTHYSQVQTYNVLADMVNKEFNASITPIQLKTWFRSKGLFLCAARNKALPLYSEYIDPNNGYIYIKISEKQGYKKNWIFKHIWIWQKAHGEIPKNHHIIFLDNNKQNTSIENLMLVHRSVEVHLVHNGMRFDDPELTKAGIAIAKLQFETRKKLKIKLGDKEFGNYIRRYRRKIKQGGKV